MALEHLGAALLAQGLSERLGWACEVIPHGSTWLEIRLTSGRPFTLGSLGPGLVPHSDQNSGTFAKLGPGRFAIYTGEEDAH